jgi:multiple sugar transport system permease protein
MLISSTHDNYDITTQVNVLPGNEFISNYERLTENLNIWRGFANSFYVACIQTVLALYFPALTAYAFSKFRFKGRSVLFSIVLVAMMIPGQVGIIGFFKEMSDIGLLNSYIPLVVPSMASCFGMFFFKQYLDGSLPNEIVEAAYVDGCKDITIFHRIVIPILLPALVTQGVMVFISSWNSYMTPLIILQDSSKMTLPILIAAVKSANSADYGAQYVGILISVIPLITIFSFASSMIMDKISVGAAVKG